MKKLTTVSCLPHSVTHNAGIFNQWKIHKDQNLTSLHQPTSRGIIVRHLETQYTKLLSKQLRSYNSQTEFTNHCKLPRAYSYTTITPGLSTIWISWRPTMSVTITNTWSTKLTYMAKTSATTTTKSHTYNRKPSRANHQKGGNLSMKAQHEWESPNDGILWFTDRHLGEHELETTTDEPPKHII